MAISRAGYPLRREGLRLGLKKGTFSHRPERRMYNIKPSLSPLSLYYLFSLFLHAVSAPRYAFEVLNLPIFCASMILDDCLMTIIPHCLLPTSIFHNHFQPTSPLSRTPSLYTIFFTLLPRISLVHLIVSPFSSQLSLQLELLFVLFVVPVRGIITFLGHCYTAFIHRAALHHHVLILSE